MSDTQTLKSGLTLRSLIVALVGMFFCSILITFVELHLRGGDGAEQALPVPVMAILISIIVIIGFTKIITKLNLLTRPEVFCIFIILMLSTPLMTQGLWYRFVGLIASPPRIGKFDRIDAYNDKLWPHGKNLIGHVYSKESLKNPKVNWEEREYNTDKIDTIPYLENKNSSEISQFSFSINTTKITNFIPHAPFLFSTLIRTEGHGPETEVSFKVQSDNNSNTNKMLSVNKADMVTYIHQKGFERIGVYGYRFPAQTKEKLTIIVSLKGRGKAYFAEPKLYDVSPLENIFEGRQMMLQSEYDKTEPHLRPANVLIKPDNMLSLAGAKYFIGAYIPWGHWMGPLFIWGSFIILLLACTFAVNVMMRKQWAESERYPFPLLKIPTAIIGEPNEPEDKPFSKIFKNPYLWAGFALAIIWGGLKGWKVYNSAVPDVSIDLYLGSYFTDPGWNGAFNVSFTVTLFIVSIAVFFELNILLSIVVGFWIFRLTYWLGGMAGISDLSGFPWQHNQSIGAYLGYFFVTLFFTRKYLYKVLKKIVSGGKDQPTDLVSYRVAFVILLLSFFGIILWAKHMEMPIPGILLYFSFLISVGFVATKFRCECGVPYGYFAPQKGMIFITLLGGMTFFGPQAMIFTLICSGFMTVSVFMVIPGVQLEAMQVSKQYNIRPRDMIITIFLGVGGGIFIGGWGFLSNAYALGADNIAFQWPFHQEYFFNIFDKDLADANMHFTKGESVTGTNYGDRALVGAGLITMVLTTIRQYFSGFWFHPIGFILAPLWINWIAWGSVFVAWIIRSLVLKFGGATSIREKMYPFFTGSLIGCTIIIYLFWAYGAYDMHHGGTTIYNRIP